MGRWRTRPDDDGTRAADFWVLLARAAADEKSALGAVGRAKARRDTRATLRVVNIVHDKQQKFERRKGASSKDKARAFRHLILTPKAHYKHIAWVLQNIMIHARSTDRAEERKTSEEMAREEAT